MAGKITKCKNCETEFNSEFKFCPECGQKSKDDLTLGVLFSNTVANYFSVDARFFRSFIPLMFKPGFLARKFVEGRRLQYLHPAQFYLFISVVFFFLYSFIARDQQQQVDAQLRKGFEVDLVEKRDSIVDATQLDSVMNIVALDSLELKEIGFTGAEFKEIDSIVTAKQSNIKGTAMGMNFDFDRKEIDSLITIKAQDELIYSAMGMSSDANTLQRRFFSQMLKLYKQKGGGLLESFYATLPIAMFFLMPLFALILKLLFFRKGLFAHHLVFSFYYFSFLFAVFSIILGANFIWNIPNWIDIIVIVSTFFYLFLSIKRFYGQGYFVSFLKTGVAAFGYFSFVIPMAFIVLLLVAFMFY